MEALIDWEKGGTQYDYNNGGTGGALDFRVWLGDFGDLGIAADLNQTASFNTSYTAWNTATRAYLATDPGVNVIMWAWCYGVNTIEENIDLYLSQMEALEADFPHIKFVYMTGRTMSTDADETSDAVRNAQIRDYCIANNKNCSTPDR